MTDLDVKQNVEAELAFEPVLKSPASIGVSVREGIVTLTGTVTNYAERLVAERAAVRAVGVKAVANELEVHFGGIGEQTDQNIARAAARALEWTSGIPHEQIKITVEKGWITLKGTVDRRHIRAAAEEVVKHIQGVEGVVNLIEVQPAAAVEVLKQSIEEALERMAEIAGRDIAVEVIGSTVILTGTVYSLAEKREAERAAWQAPGVTRVENRITVSAAA